MADDGNEITYSAAFPTPPPFYKHFTQSNVQRLKANPDAKPAELPTELRYLLPPPLPADHDYRSFGKRHNLDNPLPPLSEQNIEQVYSDATISEPHGRQTELLRLTRSVLLNYLELITILSADPRHHQPKIDDLQLLFQNAHQLINQYRPHQARETLIEMMEERIERGRAEVKGVEEMKDRIETMLGGLGGQLKENANDTIEADENTTNEQKKTQKALWNALGELEV